MGFFGKLLGRTWQKYQSRGDEHRTSGELGLALQEYRTAVAKFDGTDEEKTALEERISEVRKSLRVMQMKRAENLIEAGQAERASNAVESAMSHCETDDERTEVRKLARRLDDLEAEATRDEVAEAFEHAESTSAEMSERDEFNVLLGALDHAQARHYEELGSAFRKGWLSLQRGEFEQARDKFGSVLEEHPEDPWVHAELGRAHLALDDNERANELLAKADELADEQDIYIKLHRAQVLWAVEDFETAEEVLQVAHDLDQDDARVFRAIGEHALRSGDYEPGIQAVEIMLEDAATDVGLLRMLAQLHHAKGDQEQALEFYEQVQKLRWSIDQDSRELVFDPQSALAAAQIYLEQERKQDRAIDLLHAMLSVTTGESAAAVHSMMAEAYRQKGKEADARDALDKALRLLPEEHEKRSELEEKLAALD